MHIIQGISSIVALLTKVLLQIQSTCAGRSPDESSHYVYVRMNGFEIFFK